MKLVLILVIYIIHSITGQVVVDNSHQLLGEFPTYAHGLTGQVFADLSDPQLRTIRIKNLNYDGSAPDAYFWAGITDEPDTSGFIIPDENGSVRPLKGYQNADIVLRLPVGKSLHDIKWLSVWCRRYRVNFGDIKLN